MTVEVYYWSPKPPSIGHAAIMVDGGEPAGKVYLSAWPGNPVSILMGPAEYQHHMDDVIAENREPQVVRLRRLKETAIKSAIKHIRNVGIYSFSMFNCAQQAYACLRLGVPVTAGGLLSGAIVHLVQPGVSLDNLVVTTPRGLFDYAQSLTKDYG